MLSELTSNIQVYLVTGYTDMRRSIDGLATIVQSQLNLDPYNRALFLFCGRRCDRIKVCFGKMMVFFFYTSDWITEAFNGRVMKPKPDCFRRSKRDGFWRV